MSTNALAPATLIAQTKHQAVPPHSHMQSGCEDENVGEVGGRIALASEG